MQDTCVHSSKPFAITSALSSNKKQPFSTKLLKSYKSQSAQTIIIHLNFWPTKLYKLIKRRVLKVTLYQSDSNVHKFEITNQHNEVKYEICIFRSLNKFLNIYKN